MIILGEKYKFNQIELNKLKKFGEIRFLKYDGSRANSIHSRKIIKELLKNNYHKYLVINTDFNIDKKMIKFITLLQLKYHIRAICIVSMYKFLENVLHKIYIDDSSNVDFLGEIKPYTKVQYFVKRIFDLFFGTILWIIEKFLRIYVAKKIAKQSPGKLYFVQKRVGINLKIFNCYKYRTMHENSQFYKYTKPDDERIFSFGKFMRKTRIDEIPQAINVLKGDMHLIGPRAEWDILVREYEKEIPCYNERHIVRPGITGWAQVNYPYGENLYDTKQKLMYDLYYIKHWSLWLDIKTIFKTIEIMFGKKGI